MVQKSQQKSKVTTPAKSGAVGLSSFDFFLPFFQYMDLPKGTSEEGYFAFSLNLPAGVIRKIWAEFPNGCMGLVGVQLWRGPRQIFPLPEGVWLRSNDSVLNFAFSEIIDREPFTVELRAYNLDDTYNHTVWIGLEMSGPKAALSQNAQAFLSLM